MANMEKTNQFLEAVKAAGLEEAFGKMCTLASQTIGCDLEDLIDDTVFYMEQGAGTLTPVWKVVYQDRYMEKNGWGFWILHNDRAKAEGRTGWVAERTFTSQEAAQDALNKFIAQQNGKGRVKRTKAGNLAVDIVIDDEDALGMEVIHWKISRQYKSEWIVEQEK